MVRYNMVPHDMAQAIWYDMEPHDAIQCGIKFI